MAVIAGVVAVAVWIAVTVLDRVFAGGSIGGRIAGLAATGAGVAVLWLADRYDIMAPSFTPPLVDLYAKDDGAHQGAKRTGRD